LLLDNLPSSLVPQRDTLARCLEAMNRALPLRAVYLFGSHARGEARPDSDVDLCLVAEGAEQQLKAAQDRYPGFDFDDPDWPVLRQQIEQVTALHAAVQARLAAP
jgi:predicted nucleotidyltransferase